MLNGERRRRRVFLSVVAKRLMKTQIRHTRVMNLLGSVCYDDDHGSRDGEIKRIYCCISFCLLLLCATKNIIQPFELV